MELNSQVWRTYDGPDNIINNKDPISDVLRLVCQAYKRFDEFMKGVGK